MLKKRRLLIIAVLILLLFSIFMMFKSFAGTDSITVKSIELTDCVGTATVNDYGVDSNIIKSDITFHTVGDLVVYKVTLENNDDEDYTISSISDNNSSSSVKYEYSDYSGEFKAKETKDITITVKYAAENTDVSVRSQSSDIEIKLVLVDEDGNIAESVVSVNDDSKINPKTGDSIGIYVVTSIVSIIALVFLVKKNGLLKSRKGIKLFSIAILASLVIPTLSRADNGTVSIYLKSKVNLYDKLVVRLNIDGVESEETVAYGGTLARPENPTKEGYTFVGWFLEDGTEYDFDSQVSGDVTIKAKFTVNQYTLTASDVTAESTASGDYDYGTEITLTAVDKTGYTFKNWSNGEITKTIEFTLTGDITVNPVYDANTYEVVFNSNEGTGSMSNQSFTYDEEKTLSANSFTRDGYTFKEWNTKADGSGDSYGDKASIKNLAESGTVNLYVIWEEKTILATANVTADNYGDYVDIGVDINADGNTTNDFRVFLNDGSNVYLIAADYIPNSMCPKSNQTTADNGTHSLNTNGSYQAYFTNILGDYNGATDISGNSLLNSNYNKWANRTNLGDYASKNNAKAVAYMLDTTAWGVKFKNSSNSSYINYVTGGPTLEQFAASYNAKHAEDTNFETAVKMNYDENNNTGYKVSRGSKALKTGDSGFSTADDSLYFYNKSGRAVDYMWLASPSANDDYRVMSAASGGDVDGMLYNRSIIGFRPLVCLKSGVSLVDTNEDGIYELQ